MRGAHDSDTGDGMTKPRQQAPAAMMFPPVTLADDRRPVWSVQVELPADIEAEVRRGVERSELSSWTVEIHGALYVYRRLFHTREELLAELREAVEAGARSGETHGYMEGTPEFWR